MPTYRCFFLDPADRIFGSDARRSKLGRGIERLQAKAAAEGRRRTKVCLASLSPCLPFEE
jgi:hypothetical protein